MSANKKPVNTPLHLLQQLSGSLLEHLENACSQALADAEKLLAKLEKQRGKAQEKLHKSRLKLQDAAAAGKAKAQDKAKSAVGELEKLLNSLKDHQTETRTYIAQLKRDAQESLKLAQGVGKVREAAAKGDARALFEVGNRYMEGRGVAADFAKAAKWYEISAGQGFAPAQYRLGNFNEKGLGMARDLEKAKTWYQLSAQQGNASAMHNLAAVSYTHL